MDRRVSSLFLLLALTFFVCNCFGDTTVKPPKHTSQDVQKRGLVSYKVTAGSILAQHGRHMAPEAQKRNFAGKVLAYLTPWNSRGYEIAKRFNSKFDYISPVWFDIKWEGGHTLIVGSQNVDQSWIADVRTPKSADHSVPRIVPRFLFDGWTGSDYEDVFSPSGSGDDAAALLVRELLVIVDTYKLDGLVLDAAALGLPPRYADRIVAFLKSLGKALHAKDRVLGYVVPPPRGDANSFGAPQMKRLRPHVDIFSLMTYDYSFVQRPGPNAPYTWVVHCVNNLLPASAAKDAAAAASVFVGLNMYGNHYVPSRSAGQGPIIGSQYLKILGEHKNAMKMQWVPAVREHIGTYTADNEEHIVYFPTLKSIAERVSMARERGVSLSLWEIGQGLDYFYELL